MSKHNSYKCSHYPKQQYIDLEVSQKCVPHSVVFIHTILNQTIFAYGGQSNNLPFFSSESECKTSFNSE